MQYDFEYGMEYGRSPRINSTSNTLRNYAPTKQYRTKKHRFLYKFFIYPYLLQVGICFFQHPFYEKYYFQ